MLNTEFNEYIQHLQVSTVSTGMFYLLIWRNVLNKKFFWKRNGANQPIQSEPVYFPRISHISVQFFVIFVPDIFVHSYVLSWILTTTHTFVLVSFCFCSSSLFTMSLHFALSIPDFSSTSACAKGRHCFT